MEEKREVLPEQPEKTGEERDIWYVPEGVSGDTNAVFRFWESEGLAPADMYRRVSELFDLDPREAMKLFGQDFMDTVDYFTHYWA